MDRRFRAFDPYKSPGHHRGEITWASWLSRQREFEASVVVPANCFATRYGGSCSSPKQSSLASASLRPSADRPEEVPGECKGAGIEQEALNAKLGRRRWRHAPLPCLLEGVGQRDQAGLAAGRAGEADSER